MWWSINSVSTARKRWRESLVALAALCLLAPAMAQVSQIDVPSTATAGSSLSVSTAGNGKATYYLAGPGGAVKGSVELGHKITLPADEIKAAGRYLMILCQDACRSAAFFVTPATAAKLDVLVHPSRVPVEQPDAISAVAFAFDRFHNLVLAPQNVQVQLSVEGSPLVSRVLQTHDGAAWMRTSSGKRAGKVRLTASLGDISTERVVQQVASDPCNLRIETQRTAKGTWVETQPLRDCAGNPVPDGTIVTFTETGTSGKSTIDAPVKQGVARAMISPGPATVTVASGVVMGNELHVGAQP